MKSTWLRSLTNAAKRAFPLAKRLLSYFTPLWNRLLQSLRGLNYNPIRSIGARLFIAFFVVIVIAVSGVGFLSYGKSKDIIRHQATDSQENTVIQTGEKLDMTLTGYQNAATQLAIMSELSSIVQLSQLGSDNRTSIFMLEREIEERMNAMTSTDKNVMAVHLIPVTEGLPTLATAGAYGADYSGLPWLEQAKTSDAGFWLPTMVDGPTGIMPADGFGYVELVKDVNTLDLNYILLMEIRASVVQDTIGTALGDEGALFLVEEDGNVLSSAQEEEMMKPFSIALEQPENPVETSAVDARGQEMLLTQYHTSINGWKVVAMQPLANLMTETKTIFNLTIWMIVAGAIAALVIGYFVMTLIGRPLAELTLLIKQAAGGDLSVQSPQTKRKDEIGTLAASFNEMISHIRDLVDASNKSVREVMDTANELSDASRRTALSAKEIALATEQIALGSANVAGEAEKVGEMTSVMGGRMKETVQANAEMARAAADIQQQNKQGTVNMNELSEKTAETERLTSTMVERVEILKDSTGSIRGILSVLDQQTKQTNILSLNATIEAARAGEAGRGFMVVADEIRKLADQSKQNIKMVGDITDKIQKEIEETVQVMTKAYPLFREQIDSVKETSEIFVSVNEHMSSFIVQLDSVTASVMELEQTQQSLVEAMTSVSAVAQQSSATTEEVAGLSSEQEKVGDSLVGLAGRLEDVSIRLRDTLNLFRL